MTTDTAPSRTHTAAAEPRRLSQDTRDKRLRLRPLPALAALLLLACSAMAQGPTSDPDVDVTIGFQGLKIQASQGFSVSLNGAAVSGSAADCGAFPETSKALTTLKLDTAYDLTPSGGLCWIHIHFDVPECYTLYVDGKETTDLLSENPGVQKVLVRRTCTSGRNGSGESAGPQLGSVVWEVGLGSLSDGRSAENISIRERALSAAVYTPSALNYAPPSDTDEVDVVRDVNGGSLRQIKATESLADVITVSPSEYDVRFYTAAQVGAKDVNSGLYQLTGQPFVTWKVKNPNPLTVDRLQISKIRDGVTETSEYARDGATGAWSLSRSGGAIVSTSSDTFDAVTGDRTRVRVIKDGAGTVASKVAQTFHQFPWGEALTKEIIDPDGAALATLYTYFEDASETNRYGKVESVVKPDASWEKYDYDFVGNRTLVLRPWKDQALATATDTNSRATRYEYDYYRTDYFDEHQLRTYLVGVEESIAGTLVSRRTVGRSQSVVGGVAVVTETTTVYMSATEGQISSVTTYDPLLRGGDAWLANRTAAVTFPDGRQDSYTYEKGDYVPNADPALRQFTPAANGLAQRVTIVHGTETAPDGVTNRSSKDVSLLDGLGRVVLREKYVYTGAGYERVAWAAMDYDASGHLTQVRQHNGQTTSSAWAGDHKTSDVDESGVETAYTYDSVWRVKTLTRKGVAASGSFPAQPDLVTTFGYDAEGRTLSETVTGGGLTLSKATAYDPAGRVSSETDQAGLITSYAYANGGLRRTVTLPGGATQVTDNYLDGQTRSVTGSAAAVARYMDYGVNPADGTKYTQEFIGSAGAASPRWGKTTTDWAGHVIRIEKPSFTGGSVAQTYTYNARGQLAAEGVVAGANKLQSDKLYEYDGFGNLTRAGLDLDGSGGLTTSSTDRIVDSDIFYEKSGTDWFRVATTKTYLTSGATATTVQTQRERLNNFPVNGTERTLSERSTVDVAGNLTRVTLAVDRAARRITATTDAPDSNVDAVDVTYNGLLQSSAGTTPQAATTYTYDGLGRTVGVIDPQVGATTKSYDAATGRLLSQTQGAGTVTYEYYPSTHPSAGRVKAQTDANSKKVYFGYDLRRALIQKWGDTTYPTEYVYDSYGQRSELHTFRGGSGWSAGAWPSATTGTPDVTRWTYHPATGLLIQKQDAAGKQVSYGYDALGRLATRAGARAGVSTSYSYDDRTAELTVVDYADATPDITFVYDRGGRKVTVTDAGGTHMLTNDAAGNVLSEQILSGILDGLQVTAGYDAYLRRSSLQTARNSTTLSSQTYTYDAAARLSTVTSGTQTATYSYQPTTGLLGGISFTGGTGLNRTYDTFARLQTISTVSPSLGTVAGYTYTYNALNQRTRVTREDNSYWSHGYNDRGELVSAKKFWGDDTPVAGQQTVYAYDNVGNRNSAGSGGDAAGANLRQAVYGVNALNQYTQRGVPGAVDVMGAASSAATVTVNNQATYRKGTYFHKALTLDNSAAPVYAQVNVSGVTKAAGTNGEDAVTQQSGYVYLAKATETYTYDDDGNLTSDGRWSYAWDGENRLVSMTAIPSAPAAARKRLEFAYDWMGRRIQKKLYAWNASTGSYQLQAVTKCLYDGWDLVAELDGGGSLIRSYTQSGQGAGDGSGLLFVNEAGSSYVVGYDGNGNVAALLKASDGTVAAAYDYNGFGEVVTMTGTYAARNPFRFAGKYLDQETGLIYYGYRYYNPQTGGWISRDPSEEAGGLNLYGFVNNDGVNGTDVLGLWRRDEWSGGWYSYTGHAIAEKCDRLAELARLITGDENDWKLLSSTPAVKEGDRVDITPLLKNLETRLRGQVAGSTRRFNSEGFPGYNAEGIPEVTPWSVIGASQAGAIDRFFSKTPYGRVGCDDAASIILSKGLLNVVGASLFDTILSRLGDDPLAIFKSKEDKISSMLVGDSGWIPNYPDYQGLPSPSDYGHENSIKVARGQYFGHPLGRFSKQQLERRLQEAYVSAGGARRTDKIPGFRDEINIQITFLDVAKIFGVVFDIRREAGR